MKINPHIKRQKRTVRPVDYYIDGLRAGNRYILSEAITLIESTEEHYRYLGLEILDAFYNSPAQSIRIGLSGSPGVGKSTFLDTYGMRLINAGKKIAILAIDPSSTQSKGSILGDKTRMEALAKNTNAFVRPSPSGKVMGGVGAFTKEAILLCEAAGFDTIFVETVGVGQSEIEVANIVDLFMLLVLPGAGDDIQGIKRGITEIADMVIIHKADGDRKAQARISRKQYQAAMQLMRRKIDTWSPQVLTASSLDQIGMEKIQECIEAYLSMSKEADFFNLNRINQDLRWFEKLYNDTIMKYLLKNHQHIDALDAGKQKIINHEESPYQAISKLARKLETHV